MSASLTVIGAPRLATSESVLSFAMNQGETSQPLTFDVWNGGAGSLAFSVADNADWLTVSPSSETSTGGADRKTLTATASAAELSTGDYSAAITISADGAADATVSASLTASPPAAPSNPPPSTGGGSSSGGGGAPRLPDPAIAFSPSALSFIGERTTVARRFEVWNAERGDMGFSVSSGASWLSFSPRRHVSEGPSDIATITATANTAGLEPGAHRAAITITQLSGEEDSATLRAMLTLTDENMARTLISAVVRDNRKPGRYNSPLPPARRGVG